MRVAKVAILTPDHSAPARVAPWWNRQATAWCNSSLKDQGDSPMFVLRRVYPGAKPLRDALLQLVSGTEAEVSLRSRIEQINGRLGGQEAEDPTAAAGRAASDACGRLLDQAVVALSDSAPALPVRLALSQSCSQQEVGSTQRLHSQCAGLRAMHALWPMPMQVCLIPCVYTAHHTCVCAFTDIM